MEFIKQMLETWGDGLWLLVALVIPRTWPHRAYAVCYVGACMFMLRQQIEFMIDLGYPHGILPLFDVSLFIRGLWAYGLIHVLYFAMAYFSAGSRNVVFMAATITLFLSGLIFSSILMVL